MTAAAPDLLLVAHGTRDARGVATLGELAEALRRRGPAVHLAFVDVLGPTVAEALATVDGPVVLVPAFLASGYHVRTDVPAAVQASGRPDVRVTAALGPDPVLARVQRLRLVEAGWRPGDAVVLAAAGSADTRALADVETAAGLLAAEVGGRVAVGYVATATPTVPEAVARLGAQGARRVLVSPYLLAPGLFSARLAAAGANAVAAPLGVHAEVVEVLLRRYRERPAASRR